MLVRLEPTKDSSISLVIDEIDRFIGEITDIDFITKCCEDKETIVLYGYDFYTVNKEQLLKFCKK